MSLERFPGARTPELIGDSFPATLEAMREDAARSERSLVAESLQARAAVTACKGPERAHLEERINVSAADAQKKLRGAFSAAALALALNAAPMREPVASERISAAAEALAEDPELAREVLTRVLAAAEARPEVPESFVRETNSVLERLQEPGENKYTKLSLRVGEIAARTLVNAAGFGIGVGAYEILKEVVKTARSAKI